MTSTPPARSRPAVLTDRVVGVALALATGFIALALLSQISMYTGLAVGDGSCANQAVDGLRCSPDFLNTMIIVGYVLVVFGWCIPIGFMVVRFLRRRLGWFMPLIAFAATLAGFYIVTLVLYASYLPAK